MHMMDGMPYCSTLHCDVEGFEHITIKCDRVLVVMCNGWPQLGELMGNIIGVITNQHGGATEDGVELWLFVAEGW